MVSRAKQTAADEAPDVGMLIRTSKVSRRDVEEAAARLFDGKTPLPLADGHALILPDLKKMTVYSREAIMTALLLARSTREDGS